MNQSDAGNSRSSSETVNPRMTLVTKTLGSSITVELLDEKTINSTGQPPQRTNPTKHANVRWADIVKRGSGQQTQQTARHTRAALLPNEFNFKYVTHRGTKKILNFLLLENVISSFVNGSYDIH